MTCQFHETQCAPGFPPLMRAGSTYGSSSAAVNSQRKAWAVGQPRTHVRSSVPYEEETHHRQPAGHVAIISSSICRLRNPKTHAAKHSVSDNVGRILKKRRGMSGFYFGGRRNSPFPSCIGIYLSLIHISEPT